MNKRQFSLTFFVMLFMLLSVATTCIAAQENSSLFSAEELSLIEASHTQPISTGIIPIAEPVCFRDKTSGEFLGITMEILKNISESTGLQFQYKPIDLSVTTPVDALKVGQFDLVAGILKTQVFINDGELVLSDALMADTLVMIGRLGEDFTKEASTKKIAVLKGFPMGMNYVQTTFPQHQIIQLDTIEACFSAVQKGKADACVYMHSCSTYLLQNPRFDNLEITQAYSKDINTCIAGLSRDRTLLLSIINKGLGMISPEERNEIIMSYTIQHPYQLSTSETAYKNRYQIMLAALLILAVIVIFVYRQQNIHKLQKAYQELHEALAKSEEAQRIAETSMKEAQNTARKLQQQIDLTQRWQEASETDDLTRLLNRNGAKKRIQAILDNRQKGMFCLFDIDDFKQVNDKFSHAVGDIALQAIASCMHSFRESDIVARYGGDEFVAFAPGILTKEQASECLERFLDLVGKIDIPEMEGQELSASIGVVLYNGDTQDDFEELCRRADEAMYYCKKNRQEKYRIV